MNDIINRDIFHAGIVYNRDNTVFYLSGYKCVGRIRMTLNFDIKTAEGERDFKIFCDAIKTMLTGEEYEPQSYETCKCAETCNDPCARGCPIAMILSPKMSASIEAEQLHKLSEGEMCMFAPCSKECREFACAVCPTFRVCEDDRKWRKLLKE